MCCHTGVQVKMQPGDVVLAHYMLAHSIAPNCSPHIRYQVARDLRM